MGNVSGKESGSGSRPASLSSLRLGNMGRSNSNLTGDFGSEDSSVVSSRASSRRRVRGVIGLTRKSKLNVSQSAGLVYDPNEIVDGGYLVPQGVYKGAITYKEKIVRQLMVSAYKSMKCIFFCLVWLQWFAVVCSGLSDYLIIHCFATSEFYLLKNLLVYPIVENTNRYE